MQVSSFLDLSKDFSAYSYAINKTKLDINDETKTRAIINRLYYALFHRILPELNELKNKSGSSQHDAIYGILLKNAPNQEVTKLFSILKALRVWADYEINNPPFDFNLNRLIERTHRVVNSSWNLRN